MSTLIIIIKIHLSKGMDASRERYGRKGVNTSRHKLSGR